MSNFKDIPDFFRQSQAVLLKFKDIPDFSVGNRRDPQMSIQGHPRIFSAIAGSLFKIQGHPRFVLRQTQGSANDPFFSRQVQASKNGKNIKDVHPRFFSAISGMGLPICVSEGTAFINC